jgi:hypothetical protein
MNVLPRSKEICEILLGEWVQVMVDSIRGGMPMINNGLTIIAFCGFLFEKFLNSDIPSRLLGVCSL